MSHIWVSNRHTSTSLPYRHHSSDTELWAGEQSAFYVSNAPEDKLPKDATAGRLMTGTLSIAKLPKSAGGAPAPGPVPFTYV